METIGWDIIENDLGRFGLAVGSRGIVSILLPNAVERRDRELGRLAPGGYQLVDDTAGMAEARAQLNAYFDGDRQEFDVPLDLRGTPFQCAVWEAVLQVPYGETTTYGEIARRIGKPGMARPVGSANGANPIPIIVPCHRIIGSNGNLTGYGGGLDLKRALLKLEGVPTDAPVSQPALLS